MLANIYCKYAEHVNIYSDPDLTTASAQWGLGLLLGPPLVAGEAYPPFRSLLASELSDWISFLDSKFQARLGGQPLLLLLPVRI